MDSAFKLDTSGEVSILRHDGSGLADAWTWDDVGRIKGPFTQGALTAALTECWEAWPLIRQDPVAARRFGYAMLSPETLARFIEDCAKAAPLYYSGKGWGRIEDGINRAAGRDFWRHRQEGSSTFPRLTLFIADDGLIHHKETAS